MCDFVYCDLVQPNGSGSDRPGLWLKESLLSNPAVTTGHIPNANTIEYCRGLEEPHWGSICSA